MRKRGITPGLPAWLVFSLCLPIAAAVRPCHAEESVDTAPPNDASSLEVSRCVTDHENARTLRLEKRWFEARESMNRCSIESCPISIRSDCRAWSEEVTRALPTLVIVVEREDGGTEPVAVHLDGTRLDVGDSTSPVEVLPGKHALTFTLNGRAAVERQVVLHEGEKNKVVRVRFERLHSQPAHDMIPVPPPAAPEATRPIPTSSYLLGGGALVSFAVSAVLLASAITDLDNARETCSPACSSGTRESIETRLLLADISGGVGLVLTGLTAYTFVSRPGEEAQCETRVQGRVEPGARARAQLGDTVLRARVGFAFSGFVIAALACASCSLAVDASDIDEQCPVDFKFCGGRCVEETDTDFGCGPTCGDTCTLVNAKAKCVGSDCVVDECAYGFAIEGSDDQGGCPVNYLADPFHCGVDQVPCPDDDYCVEGMCTQRPPDQ